MGFVLEKIDEWICELISSIISFLLTGVFNLVNFQVETASEQIVKTPWEWDSNIFSLMQTISETVIIPVAGVILTLVMCYELVNMIISKNNLHDFHASEICKWIFKTMIAVYLLTNVSTIVRGIFDLTATVTTQTSVLVSGSTGLDVDTAIRTLEATMETMSIGELLVLFFEAFLMYFGIIIISIIIFVVITNRMLEIFMMTSIAPIPFATLGNREIGSIGQNYIKSIFALGFQSFFIMVCIGIYSLLIQSIAFTGDPVNAMFWCLCYTVLLCSVLMKTASISKSVFTAH